MLEGRKQRRIVREPFRCVQVRGGSFGTREFETSSQGCDGIVELDGWR